MEHDGDLYNCAAPACSIHSRFVAAQSGINKRDYTGGGEAIVPGITICNRNMRNLYDTQKLRKYHKIKDSTPPEDCG